MISDSAMCERTVSAPELSRTSKSSYYCYLKRFLDMCLALPALLVALPVVAIAAVLIICDSPGSPIVGQKRVGKNGKIFDIYKLRVMHEGSEALSFTTLNGDPRLTRVGSFLMRTKIDEGPE